VINKQANILFIPTSICGNSAEPQAAPSQHGYYRQLMCASLARSTYTSEGFQVLCGQLAAIARHADLVRQMYAVEQATQLMLALPLSKQLESIARYYQALCTWRQGYIDDARQFERAVEEAPPQYKPRALQALGLTYHKRGELDAALPFYLAAGKAAAICDPLTLAESHRMIAVVRSMHGDHKRALADLERLFPLVREVAKYYPASYYDFLNSLAVELGEVGRVTEAEAALAIALASPFASAYPEWSETRDEIAARRVSATPSVVAFNRAPEAAPSPPAAERKPEPVGRRALNRPSRKNTFLQRAYKTIAVTSAIPHDGITQSILDRVLICIGSRAPPAYS
jgi:tetratricopeptide (TPR) repeat protein